MARAEPTLTARAFLPLASGLRRLGHDPGPMLAAVGVVHHSAWKPETNSNYGAVFPWWDLIFGTFRATPRDGHEHMRLGLDDVRGRAAQRPLWLLGSILFRSLSDRMKRD